MEILVTKICFLYANTMTMLSCLCLTWLTSAPLFSVAGWVPTSLLFFLSSFHSSCASLWSLSFCLHLFSIGRSRSCNSHLPRPRTTATTCSSSCSLCSLGLPPLLRSPISTPALLTRPSAPGTPTSSHPNQRSPPIWKIALVSACMSSAAWNHICWWQNNKMIQDTKSNSLAMAYTILPSVSRSRYAQCGIQ